jgi:biopolymer transport protein ExbB
MKALRGILGVLCLFASVSAQEAASSEAPKETISRLSRSAEQELAKSTQELSRLRDQIASEKLPLAQELTRLEDRVSELRREHDRVTRLVDEGNLELPGIKAEIKLRQDELSYVSNLLDEYAKTFESKVNISELQYCGEALATAKSATENTTLSSAEKFARQLAFAEISMKRLFDAVGGMRFPGVGIDLQGVVTEGQFAIIGPVALFRAASGVAGVVIPQSGSTNPLIRPLEGALQTGLASLVADGEGLLPLDPSRGGALKALVQKTNLVHVFIKGGPIMWPLLFASILALGTVIERVFFLVLERFRRDPKSLDQFFAAVGKGDTQGAIQIGKKSKFYVVRALGYALGHKEQSLASAVLYAQGQELKRYRRGIPILDTVITLAPLLGLLGTVVGMMGSFSLIGGDLSAPGAITGGIAEALIATAFGLGIAITCLLPFNFLNTKMEDARHEMEAAATQLELLVMPSHASSDAGRTGDSRGQGDWVIPPATHESKRPDPETRRTREALQRQMADLESEIGQRSLQVQDLHERKRGIQQALHQVRD